MDPMTIIFNSVSNLTGGLVSDVATLITALVGIAFVLMALDLIKDAVDETISEQHEKSRRKGVEEEAEARYLDMMEAEGSGDVVKQDLAKARYRKTIRKA